MSSGDKNLVMNPLERALSTDINRLQAFIQSALSETLRALLDTGVGTDDVAAGGQYLPNTAAGSPSSSQIFSGLLFVPVGSSVAASVGPGVIGLYDPDSTPSTDDSQWKLVVDPGTVTNTLTLTPNSSGALRIDVVECSRVQPDTILETDSRDVYVPSSATFTTIAVNKVAQAQMQYRIRTGTAGGGFPGTATGWTVLAVLSVPSGTTVWDTVTIWDTRPLMEDRLYSLTRASRDVPIVTRCTAVIDAASTSSKSILTGQIEAQILDRRYGGTLLSSCPQGTGGGVGSEADSLFIDLDDAQNRSATGSFSTSGMNYVYVSAPFGLPRWAKYTAGPAQRVPRSPRGVFVASPLSPDSAYGTPHGGSLTLPPCLQNSGYTAVDTTTWPPRSVCVLARVGTSASSPKSGLIARGGVHSSNSYVSANNATPLATSVLWTITPAVDFPANARAVTLSLSATLLLGGTTVTAFTVTGGSIQIQNSITGVTIATINLEGLNLASGPSLTSGGYTTGQTFPVGLTVRIPILDYFETVGTPGVSTPGNGVGLFVLWTPLFSVTGTGTPSIEFYTAPGSAQLQVTQWELIGSGC
jgi:hypothetical protein